MINLSRTLGLIMGALFAFSAGITHLNQVSSADVA
jgi:hypothetical protein